MVRTVKPDTVVIAAGAKPLQVVLPGSDKKHVVDAWDILRETVWDIGKNVVIIGANATGCETAHFISTIGMPDDKICAFLMYHQAEDKPVIDDLMHRTGRNITVIDMVNRLAQNVGSTSRWILLKSLKLSGVTMMPNTKLVEITDDSVIVEWEEGRKTIPADTVVLAMGAVSDDALSKKIKDMGVDVLVIGDASSPRKISDAIFEGFRAGIEV